MRIIKITFFNILFFIVLILISELGIRIFFPNKLNYKRTYPGQYENKYFDTSTTIVNWPKSNEIFGWVCNKSTKLLKFSNLLYNKINVEYTINDDGFRTNNSMSFNNSTKIISVLGDSFVFGVYLDDKSTIPYNLQNFINKKYDVKNFGIPGWGLDQMYLSYLKYQADSNTQIIALLYIDDDIYRVLEAYKYTEGMNKPSFEIKNNYLTPRENESRSILESLFQKSKLLNPFYRWYCELEAIRISKKIFLTLKSKTLKNNQNFIVVHIPVLEQVLHPEKHKSLINIVFYKEQHIDYIDLNEYFQKVNIEVVEDLYLNNDGHLSEKGTKFVAEILSDKLNELELK